MNPTPPSDRELRRRRWAAFGGTVLVAAALPAVFGHRGLHATLNLLFPGAGLYGAHWAAGAIVTLLAVAATVAWLRWGVDWAVAVAVIIAMVVSAALARPGPATPLRIIGTAHEFPLVVLVAGALGWLRAAAGRIPLVRRLAARRRRGRPNPELRQLPPVLRCQVASILALAGAADVTVADAVDTDDVRKRAYRIGLVARGRWRGDPLQHDHAHGRAALVLCGRLDVDQRRQFTRDAHRSSAGVPCSEPGWIRPFDATLAALALSHDVDVRQRWSNTLATTLQLRRGHRPAWLWAPLGIAAGGAPAWEHAAATVLARAAGWLDDDDDWYALRQRCLGAAARGVGGRDDERLIAAARCWLAFVDDPTAARVLQRPTVRHDPLAIALDTLATRLGDDPAFLSAVSTASTASTASIAREAS